MIEIEVANRSGAQLDVRAAEELIRAVLGAEGSTRASSGSSSSGRTRSGR
jgi:hypothetical protein